MVLLVAILDWRRPAVKFAAGWRLAPPRVISNPPAKKKCAKFKQNMNGAALALLTLIVLLVGLLYLMNGSRSRGVRELEPQIEYIPLKEVYKPWGRYGYAPDWREHERMQGNKKSGSFTVNDNMIVDWKY
jgi:hypothetical protein